MHYVVDYITTTIITIHTMLELALLIANLSPKSFVQKDMPNHLSFNDFLYTNILTIMQIVSEMTKLFGLKIGISVIQYWCVLLLLLSLSQKYSH